MKQIVVGVVLGLLVSAGAVEAQGTDGSVFVTGTVFAGIQKYSKVNSGLNVTGDTNLSGTVPGGGFSVGTWLSPRFNLQLETAFLGATEIDYELGTSGGLSLLTTRFQGEQQTTSVSVLGAYHPPARGRVRVGYLGGVAFVREHEHATVTDSVPVLPPISGLPPIVIPPIFSTETTEFDNVAYSKGIILGADVDLQMSSHLSLVPQLRVVGFRSNVSIRPGVSVRWTL